MSIIVKGIILVIFALVIFGHNLIKSKALYWAMYFIMFALIPLLWETMFWVSKKRAIKVLGTDNLGFDLFVGKVSPNVSDDLCRGRLCINKDTIKLIGKNHDKFSVVWEAKTKDIKSVGFGTVAGVRKGFTFHFKDSDVSFTCSKIAKQKENLYKALGWQ